MSKTESVRGHAWLLVALVVAWGASWPLVKLGLKTVPPLWYGCLRYAIAAACLFAIAGLRRDWRVPRGGDWRLVGVSGLLQMASYSALTGSALTVLPPGRAAVLAYTTPLWVLPLSAWWLREPISKTGVVGVALGVCGVLAIAAPSIAGPTHGHTLASALLLTASAAWAVSIVYVRSHRFLGSPLSLAPWQALLASGALFFVALLREGAPPRLGTSASLSLAFVGPVATAFAYWAMIVVGRRVAPSTVAMTLLAAPGLGLLFSALTLGEQVGGSLLLGLALIGAGIRCATLPAKPQRSRP